MKVLLVSNLDSTRPFGQFTRPFYLGKGLAEAGVEVGAVGVDCTAVTYGPHWSTARKSLVPLATTVRRAAREFRPDVIYAQELRPGMAALMARRSVPLVADFHSLPSVEWTGYLEGASAREQVLWRLAARRSWLAERLLARRADALIASGRELADELVARHRPARRPAVVLNGVDATLLDAEPSPESPFPGERQHNAVTTLPPVFPSNRRALAFLARVARELHASQAPVAVHVVGADAGERVPGLSYQGFQPELVPWIDHADVCLLPYPRDAALCGGPRNKLLEFLARGRSIVTTREGLRGVPEAEGWPGVRVASDEPGEFAAAIVEAAQPGAPELASVRDSFRDRLRWDALARQVEPVLRGAAGRA